MRHDTDCGVHAPWCAACGAEDDARQDAESKFEDDQWNAAIDVINRIKNACILSIPMGTVQAKAEAIEGLAMELVEIAQQTFDWPDHKEFEP